MNKRTRWFAALGFCSLATMLPIARAQKQVPHEETVVRTTYAKLAYATKIGTVHEVLLTNSKPNLTELESRLARKLVGWRSKRPLDHGQAVGLLQVPSRKLHAGNQLSGLLLPVFRAG